LRGVHSYRFALICKMDRCIDLSGAKAIIIEKIAAQVLNQSR